jgi:hypothetical protein
VLGVLATLGPRHNRPRLPFGTTTYKRENYHDHEMTGGEVLDAGGGGAG